MDSTQHDPRGNGGYSPLTLASLPIDAPLCSAYTMEVKSNFQWDRQASGLGETYLIPVSTTLPKVASLAPVAVSNMYTRVHVFQRILEAVTDMHRLSWYPPGGFFPLCGRLLEALASFRELYQLGSKPWKEKVKLTGVPRNEPWVPVQELAVKFVDACLSIRQTGVPEGGYAVFWRASLYVIMEVATGKSGLVTSKRLAGAYPALTRPLDMPKARVEPADPKSEPQPVQDDFASVDGSTVPLGFVDWEFDHAGWEKAKAEDRAAGYRLPFNVAQAKEYVVANMQPFVAGVENTCQPPRDGKSAMMMEEQHLAATIPYMDAVATLQPYGRRDGLMVFCGIVDAFYKLHELSHWPKGGFMDICAGVIERLCAIPGIDDHAHTDPNTFEAAIPVPTHIPDWLIPEAMAAITDFTDALLRVRMLPAPPSGARAFWRLSMAVINRVLAHGDHDLDNTTVLAEWKTVATDDPSAVTQGRFRWL